MPTQKPDEQGLEIAKSTVGLTQDMWVRVMRDADVQQRTESFVLREIVGQFYKLPPEQRNPPRRRRRTKKELGK